MLCWMGFFAGAVSSLLRPELSADADGQRLAESSRQPLEWTPELSPLARVLGLNFRTYLAVANDSAERRRRAPRNGRPQWFGG